MTSSSFDRDWVKWCVAGTVYNAVMVKFEVKQIWRVQKVGCPQIAARLEVADKFGKTPWIGYFELKKML